MMNVFNSLSERNKGFILMFTGAILLFHTLGILQGGTNIIIIGGSLYMIYLGFVKSGGQKLAQKLLKKREEQ